MQRLIFFCILVVLLIPYAAQGEPLPLTTPVIELERWHIEHVASLAYDPVARKVYAGTRSRDRERRALVVFDTTADGALTGEPRRYSVHPDPEPVGNHTTVACMLLDRRHRKLFLGVGATAKELKTSLVAYALDAKGEPTGKPLAYDSGNPNVSLLAMALHPTLNRLYTVGWGAAGVGAVDLDANGLPTGKPLLQPIGGQGKYSIDMRADGSKLYLGSYPAMLEIVDLDPAGNLTGKPRTHTVPANPQDYLRAVTGPKAVYFKGAAGNLMYLPLDAQGEAAAAAKSAGDMQVQALDLNPAGQLEVAINTGFTDALTGKWIASGSRVQELAINADGAPGAVQRESAAFARRAVSSLDASTSPVAATSSLGYGFLGNRFAGLNVRATLVEAATQTAMLPAAKIVSMSAQQNYLKFAYSNRFGTVYAAGENAISIYSLQKGGKPESVACADVSGAIAVDDDAGLLFAVLKDGRVAVRSLDAQGFPGVNGATLSTGLQAVPVLALNARTHDVYAIGARGPGALSAPAVLPRGGRLFAIEGTPHQSDAVIDPAFMRLYAVSAYNGNKNLWVWRMAADGSLATPAPTHFADGIPVAEKWRGIATAVRVDGRRRKLYLGGNSERSKGGEGAITVYDLDAQGDPAGEPRTYRSLNTGGAVGAIEISPDGWIYDGGWGDGRIFARRLDAKGEPVGDAVAWPVGDQGKSQLLLTGGRTRLLSGSHPARLEIVTLQKNGDPVGGFRSTLASDKDSASLGMLSAGDTSTWLNLDKSLRDQNGDSIVRLDLAGAPITKARVKFEVALQNGAVMAPVRTVEANINGNSAALLVPNYGLDDTTQVASHVRTSAERYREYQAWAERYALKPEERPRLYDVACGLIGLDSSSEALDAGLRTLAALGHNNAQIWGWPGISPSEIRAAAARHGFDRFHHAVYNPPSYFDFNPEMLQPEFLDKWSGEFTKSAAGMGAKPGDMTLFHMADEPGWYFPNVIDEVRKKPAALQVFRDYLKGKGMTPELLGKAAWTDVMPIYRGDVKTLPDKRLHYWTARYFAESLSIAFAAATASLQRTLNPKLLVSANLNNWPGSYYIPSPGAKIANNPDAGPHAAMGMPDWFDLGRKKAVTCMWTEDWFGDNDAMHWSLYSDLMRCAARESGIEFGGYVIGATLGGSANMEGGKYKIMALAGHGARVIDPWLFGPSAAAPGNGWSDAERIYKPLADGLRTLGRSERLLFPARPRTGTVAILFPQASQAWDANPATKYYTSELYGLHAGLIHEQYPVDFVDDYDVEGGALDKYGYSVLYVTAPNLSLQAQRAILAWVQKGGTLVLLPGAATADEYNELTAVMSDSMGATRNSVARGPVQSATALGQDDTTITVTDARIGAPTVTTSYQVAPLTPREGKALAKFADGSAAIVAHVSGKGRILSYGFWPGVSYWNSPNRADTSRLPQGWSKGLRDAMTAPARFASAKRFATASQPVVETCVMDSPAGAAVTLLNWQGTPLQEVTVTIPNPGKVSKVETMEQGLVPHTVTPQGVSIKLPLNSVDVLMLTR